MAKALLNDTLLQSVGRPVKTRQDEPIGTVVEVTRDAYNHYINYIILQTSVFSGRGNRFFAIPVSSRFIDITGRNEIILQLPKDDLTFAKKVAVDKCPKPNLKFGNSIFEFYNYRRPERTGSDLLKYEAE